MIKNSNTCRHIYLFNIPPMFAVAWIYPSSKLSWPTKSFIASHVSFSFLSLPSFCFSITSMTAQNFIAVIFHFFPLSTTFVIVFSSDLPLFFSFFIVFLYLLPVFYVSRLSIYKTNNVCFFTFVCLPVSDLDPLSFYLPKFLLFFFMNSTMRACLHIHISVCLFISIFSPFSNMQSQKLFLCNIFWFF